tara:strand:+ start:197 stop:391 length:195 start_codon:yes stop_codon:yes gene_type:complete
MGIEIGLYPAALWGFVILVSSGDCPSRESLSSVLQDESTNTIAGNNKNFPKFLKFMIDILVGPF